MAIIGKVGKKSWKMRFLQVTIHVVLVLGSITMLYPFMIMLSSSFKSHVDESSLSIVPEYLYNDDILFRKYIEARFNEESSLLAAQYKNTDLAFKQITIPPQINNSFVNDWEQYIEKTKKKYTDNDYYLSESYGRQIYARNERLFRKALIKESGKDLDSIGKRYNCSIKSWDELKIEQKEITNRNYSTDKTALFIKFEQFKSALPIRQRVYVSLDGDFIKNELVQNYGDDIQALNKKLHTQYRNWRDVRLARTIPENALREHWAHYVQYVLNNHFIGVAQQALPQWHEYLEGKYQNITTLNNVWRKNYSSFALIPLMNNEEPTEATLLDWDYFIEQRVRPEQVYIRSIEFDFRDWLHAKYNSIQKLNTAYHTKYVDFESIPIDFKQIDYQVMQTHKREIRNEFIKRNYIMVLDELVNNGRAMINTVIYTILAVLSAVIINPLAAYALSRFRPRLTHQILMILMLTMAFPTMVMGIPSFLMLKNLNLLNSFWALILPGMVDGYFIFLLKGFFDSQPRELYESAMLDGAGEFRIFWQIGMYLSKPVLAVIALGAFNEAYRNFMFAFLVCQDQSMWTLMVHIYQLMQRSMASVGYAALVIVSIPTLLVFIFFQNIIIKGIVVPTEK